MEVSEFPGNPSLTLPYWSGKVRYHPAAVRAAFLGDYSVPWLNEAKSRIF